MSITLCQYALSHQRNQHFAKEPIQRRERATLNAAALDLNHLMSQMMLAEFYKRKRKVIQITREGKEHRIGY